ncbi:hypothetical protein CVT25_007366 [Psilocybe cyanescens]|uniref:Uncharacterized protein n=1 Tax=Psilocybe cyanescens TaxID=93625 RepID=A0A409XJG2_PSICY|nr:hypothetical protein CVT25_007366 [Psilocybe cyanescens]
MRVEGCCLEEEGSWNSFDDACIQESSVHFWTEVGYDGRANPCHVHSYPGPYPGPGRGSHDPGRGDGHGRDNPYHGPYRDHDLPGQNDGVPYILLV